MSGFRPGASFSNQPGVDIGEVLGSEAFKCPVELPEHPIEDPADDSDTMFNDMKYVANYWLAETTET